MCKGDQVHPYLESLKKRWAIDNFKITYLRLDNKPPHIAHQAKIDNKEQYTEYAQQGDNKSLLIFSRYYVKSNFYLMLYYLEESTGSGKSKVVMIERIRHVVVPAMQDAMFPTLHIWQFRTNELLF